MKLETGQEFYKFKTAWPCAVSEGKMEGKNLGGKQGADQVERALWAIHSWEKDCIYYKCEAGT